MARDNRICGASQSFIVMSYNMHGFNNGGCEMIRDIISASDVDIFMLYSSIANLQPISLGLLWFVGNARLCIAGRAARSAFWRCDDTSKQEIAKHY